MAEKTLFDKKFIGNPVEIGKSADRYRDFLMKDEAVKMEFKVCGTPSSSQTSG